MYIFNIQILFFELGRATFDFLTDFRNAYCLLRLRYTDLQ